MVGARDKDGAAKRYRLDVLFIVQWLWGRKLSETTSGEANFSSRFSRIILEELSARSSPTVGSGAHIPSCLARSGFERRDSRLWSGIKEYLDFFESVCAEDYGKKYERASFCITRVLRAKVYWNTAKRIVWRLWHMPSFKAVDISRENRITRCESIVTLFFSFFSLNSNFAWIFDIRLDFSTRLTWHGSQFLQNRRRFFPGGLENASWKMLSRKQAS